MLTAFAAFSCLASPFQDSPAVRVLARDADGFGEAAVVTPERPWPVPIPLVSRSEVVQRVVPGPDGLALRFEFLRCEALRCEALDDPAAVTVEAVAHPVDHQVLIVGGEPVLVGPPVLPAEAWAGTDRVDVLPLLARQDDACAILDDLAITAPFQPGDDLSLLLLGSAPAVFANNTWTCGGQRETTRVGACADRRSAVALPGGAELWHVRDTATMLGVPATAAVIDQAFFASLAAIGAEARVRLTPTTRATGDGLELLVPSLPRGDGTWTLLVSVQLPEDARKPPERVPIDAPASAGWLVDRAAELGIAWNHLEGPDEQLDIRPTMGPGAAWGDVDGDGRMDLYLVQGGGRFGSVPRSTNRLYWNTASGFVDATRYSGGDDDGAGMGALFLDGDGDGDLDLYVANYGADVLYRNGPGGGDLTGGHPWWHAAFDEHHLTDVSREAGIGGHKWSAGVAASDYDQDGDLDLYVTSYLLFDPVLMPPREEFAYQREDPVAMLPFAFPGQANTFLRNESDARGMRFVDVTDELGLADAQGRGMQPIFFDFDRDGDDDLYVANDVSFNVLFRNEGDGTFKDVSFSAGLDDPRGGMGLATGDVDLDGDEDVFLTNWELEANALYVNNLLSHASQRHHVATFRDMIVRSGLGPAGIGVTSWGAELFDADNDGDLDLFVANGYTSPDYESTGICVGQPNHFFENDGTGRFTDASAQAGSALARKLPSRAVVACDFDQDGDVDLVVTANNGPVQLLRNELLAGAKGHWLLVRLRGADGNTHGIGAEVTVRAGGRAWRRQLRAGTSYLGGNPPELSFGLGAADAVEALEVRWPSGKTTTHAVEGVDRVVTLAE